MNKKNNLPETLVRPKEWYYLREQTPVGGFTYLEMIRLFQTKNITDEVLVWKNGMKDWTPIMTVSAFQVSEIERVLNSGLPGVVNYFTNRNFLRIPYSAKFVVHNEETLWKGVSFELGAGGVGLLVNSDQLQLGQEVFVHKTSRGGEVSINAVAEIVSKVTNNMRPGQARYGLEFCDISREDREKIQQFAEVFSESKKIA